MGRRISLGELGKGSIERREGECLLRFEGLYVFNLCCCTAQKGGGGGGRVRLVEAEGRSDENELFCKNEISTRFCTDSLQDPPRRSETLSRERRSDSRGASPASRLESDTSFANLSTRLRLLCTEEPSRTSHLTPTSSHPANATTLSSHSSPSPILP